MFAMMFRFGDDVEIFNMMLFVLLERCLHQVLAFVAVRHFEIPVNKLTGFCFYFLAFSIPRFPSCTLTELFGAP
jgi:hypothetical protein